VVKPRSPRHQLLIQQNRHKIAAMLPEGHTVAQAASVRRMTTRFAQQIVELRALLLGERWPPARRGRTRAARAPSTPVR
jgi:hypothetical protein